MKKVFINNIFVIALVILSLILVITNYSDGTILSGWDTLHPEFNFAEYFKRILFGVWESHQGLGALSSQAHPSELSRMILYYPLSFVLPLSFLRYSYFFLTLILGPLGVYFFTKKVLLKEDTLQNQIASFGAGAFYFLNLGTLQHYFVPLEMFATHFATLPWLFLFVVQYLEYGQKKDLLIFAIFTFFSTSIAHTSTLWFAYFFALILFLFVYNLLNKKRESRMKSAKIILLTLLINSFWLLPNLYFILTQGTEISNSKINALFTEEAFANNKLFGTTQDIMILKSFLFNWSAYFPDTGSFGPLMKVWINHLQQPFVLITGYGLSAIALLGLLYSIVKKNLISFCLLAIFVLSFFFLLTDNPPFGFIFSFLQNSVPLFREAIRFPFTKFSILLIFAMSCYFAFGTKFIIKKASIYSFIIIFAAFIYFMLPAFQGNLISPLMKVKIPQSYFSVFKLLNEKPYGRVATLPIHSFWGWNYYSWNYQGAGFSWFGLKDPVLEREFDRWNPANEQYYREISQAIYSQDQEKLNNVFKKYDIAYVFWDTSIIAPDQGKDKKALFQNETEKLLNNNSSVQQIGHFGDLLVYRTNFNNPQVRLIENPISIGPSTVSYDDFAYTRYNNYITYSNPGKNTILYPFRGIIDNQNRITSKEVLSSIPKPTEELNPKLTSNTQNSCPPENLKEKANFQKTIVYDKTDNYVEYSSIGGSFCDYIPYSLPRNQAYIISITSRNIKGLPLRVCIENYITKRCDLFVHLSKFTTFQTDNFLITPLDQGLGFGVSFNNFSVKNIPSINEVKSITMHPFDYKTLSQTETYPAFANQDKNKKVIVYSQSFDSGWKAYIVKENNWLTSFLPFIFGKEIKEHVLANNWANGWVLDDKSNANSKFVIIYWPQYLEYIGLVILLITFVGIILYRKRGI